MANLVDKSAVNNATPSNSGLMTAQQAQQLASLVAAASSRSTSPTPAASWAANTVDAGPAAGVSGPHGPRRLVVADLPRIPASIVDGIPSASDASSTVKGVSYLSVDPVTATTPIAAGSNDPRVQLFGATTGVLATQTANTVLRGPVSGSPSQPVFGVLVSNDIPTLALTKLATQADQTILGNNSGGAASPSALSAAQVKTLLSLNNVENTALSTWAGSTNLTTLGTIGTGVWQGTAIADSYIASAAAWSAKQAAGNYITALTGNVTASGPGSKHDKRRI